MTCTATRTREPTMPRPLGFDEDPFGSLYDLPQEDEMFPVFPCDDISFPKFFDETDKRKYLAAKDLDQDDVRNVDNIASIFESLANEADQFHFEPEKKKVSAVSIDEIALIFGAMVDETNEIYVEPKEPKEKKVTRDKDVMTRQLGMSEAEEKQDATNIDEIASIFDSMADEASAKESDKKKKPKEKKISQEQYDMARHLGISEAAMRRMLQTRTNATVVEPPQKYIPMQTFLPPSAVAVDFRCFQPTAFAQGKIDPRIPSIVIPKMDAQFRLQELRITTEPEHDEKTCDICQSNKTPQRKAILHRWRIRRQRRNWSKGPRYGGRSSVASNRTRVNGRFVPTARWV